MAVFLTVLLVAAKLASQVSSRNLEVVYQWKVVKYATPPGYPDDPEYQERTTFLTGFEITPDRIFYATPRITRGNPASLSTVRRGVTSDTNSPPLQAYPGWDWHAPAVERNITNCNRTIVSVFRMARDNCNRLWVMDSGVMDSSTSDAFSPCRPKILIFDLATDRLVKLITLPASVVTNKTLTTNIVLDDQNFVDNTYGSCNSGFAYMTDTVDHAIIVFNSARNTFWRMMHPSTNPDPNYFNATLEGESFTLTDGVLGMAVSGIGLLRNLYYQAYAALPTNQISTRVVQRGPYPDPSTLPVSVAFNKTSQGLDLGTSPLDGSIIYNPIASSSILSWDPMTRSSRLLAYSPDLIKPVPEFKTEFGNNRVIWFLSFRLQKYFTGNVNPDEINMRLIKLLLPYL